MSETYENIRESRYAGVLLKPDAIAGGLADQIVGDITSSGFEILFSASVCLSSDDVCDLYPNETSIPVGHRKLKEYLVEKPSILMCVRLADQSIDATATLQELKGDKLKGTGIRGKYCTTSLDLEDIENKTSDYYMFIMRNYLHVFDDPNEFWKFAERLGVVIWIEE